VLTTFFTKLKEILGYDLVELGYSAHSIHNNIQTVIDVFPVDIKGIIPKIYSYFYLHIITV
jgi:hypothetical protein